MYTRVVIYSASRHIIPSGFLSGQRKLYLEYLCYDLFGYISKHIASNNLKKKIFCLSEELLPLLLKRMYLL